MVKLSVCARSAPSHEKVSIAEEEDTMSEDEKYQALSDKDKAVAKQALRAMATGLVLDVEYDGLSRLVEVHTVGLSKTGYPVMRVYQLEAGQSHSGNPSPWRLLSLDKVTSAKLVDMKSYAPREGYRKGDAGMRHIFTEL